MQCKTLVIGGLLTATAVALPLYAANAAQPTGSGHVGSATSAAAPVAAGSASASVAAIGQVYRFELPRKSNIETFSVRFPGLPAGAYDVSYDVLASLSGPSDALICDLIRTDGSEAPVTGRGFRLNDGQAAVSASGEVDLRKGAPVNLTCVAHNAGQMSVLEPSYITFTKVADVQTRSAAIVNVL